MNWAIHLERRLIRPFAWSLLSFVLLIGAFFLDCVSGNEVSSSLFYVVGIGLAAWLVGRRTALVLALLSTVAWGAAVRLVGPSFSKPSVLYWNLAVELATYVTIALALSRIRRGLLHERELFEQLNVVKGDLDRELKAVGGLQRELLPAKLPELPGYEWQVTYATSAQAGGDYYDFFVLPDERLGILLCDASGHGPQAAVLMAMTRVLMRTASDALAPPDQVLARLGLQLAQTVPSGRFVTACYAVLEPSSGRLEFSLAGHPPPLHLSRSDGVLDELPMRGGPPLGLFTGVPFDAGEVTIRPGDTLILYTDGLTEGMSPSRELFGDERLREAVCGLGSRPLIELRDRVVARLNGHRAGAELADDLTLLMLRRAP